VSFTTVLVLRDSMSFTVHCQWVVYHCISWLHSSPEIRCLGKSGGICAVRGKSTIFTDFIVRCPCALFTRALLIIIIIIKIYCNFLYVKNYIEDLNFKFKIKKEQKVVARSASAPRSIINTYTHDYLVQSKHL
jgi:hypothetical protein